jgi:hypothetical protein
MTQIGIVEEDEYMTAGEYKFSKDRLTLHNPLVHWLVEQILTVQRQNRMIVEAFDECFQEIAACIEELEEEIDDEGKVLQPRRILFEGKEISQADFEALIEYTCKLHIESMTSFGGKSIKNKSSFLNASYHSFKEKRLRKTV